MQNKNFKEDDKLADEFFEAKSDPMQSLSLARRWRCLRKSTDTIGEIVNKDGPSHGSCHPYDTRAMKQFILKKDQRETTLAQHSS